MLLTRLYLRNFRVYEDELELELPPGLVGIYGPNGSGKSTLLEAVLFTLWGRARTTREQIRSSGVGGDCVTEVEFEHEGHLYLVRRTLHGVNATAQVEAHCDGAVMSTGTRDAERYLQSILGMDDGAFRASVFAEQNQLAAFSDQSPAERRRLVLQLLGITPLDTARDAARKDARQSEADHGRLRGLLPDVAALEVGAADAAASADAADTAADDEQRAAEASEEAEQRARRDLEANDRRRQEHDALVIEGRASRQQLDSAIEAIAEQRAELEALAAEASELALLEPVAARLAGTEEELRALEAAAAAAAAAAALAVPPEPPPAEEGPLDEARGALAAAREEVAALEALQRAAGAELDRARQLRARSATLSGEADCPVCGQALGAAFEQVQAHRAEEVREAEARVAALGATLAAAGDRAGSAQRSLDRLVAEVGAARSAREEWERASLRREEARSAFSTAWAAAVAAAPHRALPPSGDGAATPTSQELARAVAELRPAVAEARRAASRADHLRGRLERRPALETSLAANEEKAAAAEGEVTALRDKVRSLGFDRAALDQAAVAHAEAASASRAAAAAAREAALRAARSRTEADAAARRLGEGRAQHAALADLEDRARQLARVSDLLSDFRNTVVASVGPRLAVQAAELFGELTDHEYEELQVDPDTYQLQISDGGRLYGLERFSGSEIDLANLALRVAISEHIHFQSGGSVGLLVLDEVFGPLDADRKARMLLALERLRGRFRQVLVVTHDSEIKEQLPNAIEVLKRPGRRATARVLGG